MKLQEIAEDIKEVLMHSNKVNPLLEITVSNGCN